MVANLRQLCLEFRLAADAAGFGAALAIEVENVTIKLNLYKQ